MKRLLLLFAAAIAALSLTACRRTPPTNVAAEVNSRAITNAEPRDPRSDPDADARTRDLSRLDRNDRNDSVIRR